ncbi:MAG: flagellar protein FlaG, partial [Treponema sp.]|nr:flagellar protein FlaG [Treponema sp.]
LPQTAAEVSRTLADNLAEAKETCQNIQKLSDLVLGHKLQFSVNEKLNKVIVEVVDPSTNKIIREIPSEDLQRIQVQMKQAIGVLFDEMI